MTGRKSTIKGYKLNEETGVLEPTRKHMPVNKRIASKKRKRVVTRAQAVGIKPK